MEAQFEEARQSRLSGFADPALVGAEAPRRAAVPVSRPFRPSRCAKQGFC